LRCTTLGAMNGVIGNFFTTGVAKNHGCVFLYLKGAFIVVLVELDCSLRMIGGGTRK